MENKITVSDISLKTEIYIVSRDRIESSRIKSIKPSRRTNGHVEIEVGYRDLDVSLLSTQLSGDIFLNYEDARLGQLDLRLKHVEEKYLKLQEAQKEYHEAITKYGFDILTPKPENEKKQV